MGLVHLSHSDLDGIGSLVVGSAYAADEGLTYFPVPLENNEVDDTIIELMKGGFLGPPTTLLITDLSPNGAEAAKVLEILGKQNRVTMIDHHKSAKERFGHHPWAHINLDRCAAYLACRKLLDPIKHRDLYEFTEVVDDFDRFILKDPRSDRMAVLVNGLGKKEFYNRFCKNPSVKESESESAIIDALIRMRGEYIENAIKNSSLHKDGQGRTFALVFNEEHSSHIGKALLDRYPGADYVLMVNAQRKTASMRSREGGTDVSLIAKENGGGGHAQAAGYPLKDDGFKKLVAGL